MSVSSILAFVGLAAAARTKSVQVARRSEERIAELVAKVAELEDAIATANVQARRDQELIDIWRERALGTPAMREAALRPAGPDFRPPQVALQQAHAQMQALQAQQSTLAQYNQQAAMNAQNFYNQGAAQYQNQMLGQAQPLGLLGAQNLIDAELWCNCVPARHDMLLRGR